MGKLYCFLFFTLASLVVQIPVRAQGDATIGGLVQTETGRPLPGATVFVKGTFVGGSTNREGRFVLKADFSKGPVVLLVSFVGYENLELFLLKPDEGLQIALKPVPTLTNEVIASASRVEEGILQAPVTVEKVTTQQIQRLPPPDVQVGLNQFKSIDVNSASMLMSSLSTRGFNSAISERLIQLTDYFDTQSPSLNVNSGNLQGLPELYEMPFAVGQLEDYQTVDAYLGYTLPKLSTTVQAGASNLLDNRNVQVYGGPSIGRLAYLGLLIDLK